MDQYKQQIAIAQACGKQHCPSCPDRGWYQVGCGQGVSPEQCEWCNVNEDSIFNAPDYLNDLNAMHEALKMLSLDTGEYGRYLHHLSWAVMVSGSAVRTKAENFKYNNANAGQRAKALLKTIGKWEDE